MTDSNVLLRQDLDGDFRVDNVEVGSQGGVTIHRQRVVVRGVTLTERMLNFQITAGYRLHVDEQTDWTYMAEAPVGADPSSSPTWRGVRIPSSTNAVKAWAEADSFVWDDRASAGWT